MLVTLLELDVALMDLTTVALSITLHYSLTQSSILLEDAESIAVMNLTMSFGAHMKINASYLTTVVNCHPTIAPTLIAV